MPMPPYPLYCYRKGCANLAVYKVAARWSDGITSELKTYALSCAECLREQYHRSLAKQKTCRLAKGEALDPPGIYVLERGKRDVQMQRRPDLEQQLTPAG